MSCRCSVFKSTRRGAFSNEGKWCRAQSLARFGATQHEIVVAVVAAAAAAASAASAASAAIHLVLVDGGGDGPAQTGYKSGGRPPACPTAPLSSTTPPRESSLLALLAVLSRGAFS